MEESNLRDVDMDMDKDKKTYKNKKKKEKKLLRKQDKIGVLQEEAMVHLFLQHPGDPKWGWGFIVLH